MRIKIRRIPHKFPKELGYSDEKWARGGKGKGYARSYGHYSGSSSARTRIEIQNTIDRREIEEFNHDNFSS